MARGERELAQVPAEIFLSDSHSARQDRPSEPRRQRLRRLASSISNTRTGKKSDSRTNFVDKTSVRKRPASAEIFEGFLRQVTHLSGVGIGKELSITIKNATLSIMVLNYYA